MVFPRRNRTALKSLARQRRPKPRISPSSCCRSPISRAIRPRLFRRRHHREPHHRPLAHPQQLRDRAQHGVHLQGQGHRRQGDRQGARGSLCARRLGAARSEPCARQRPTHRRGIWRASLGGPVRGRRRRPVQAAGSGRGATGQYAGQRTRQGGSGKGARSKNPDAIDLDHARPGFAAALQQQRRRKQQCGASLFEQALEIDPNNADALAGEPTPNGRIYFGWATPDRLRCQNNRPGRPGHRARPR